MAFVPMAFVPAAFVPEAFVPEAFVPSASVHVYKHDMLKRNQPFAGRQEAQSHPSLRLI